MGHKISAVILKGGYDAAIAEQHDLRGVPLGFELTMFPIDHYYTACWEKLLGVAGCLRAPARFDDLIFPCERVVAELMTRITLRAEPLFAIIVTDYFGGVGSQGAGVYRGAELASDRITAINQALQYLGVKAQKGYDEFDTVGLGGHRSMPDYLHKYVEMADELGV
jgi:hypothetical protein